jgi:hypothetical protein
MSQNVWAIIMPFGPVTNFLLAQTIFFISGTAYMFNVHKNHLSRQTGSRNLTGSKTLPTIWYTYMKLVTVH